MTLCLFVVWVSFVVCNVSRGAALWKLNQGQTRKWLVTGRPPSVSGAVVDWNPSINLLKYRWTNSGCNFLQNADFKRISINNGPFNRGWFPCGLMCDWSVSVMSLQWLSKCNLGRLPFVASAADSRNKSKQIWSAAVKHIFQHKERKKTKQNKTKNCRLS